MAIIPNPHQQKKEERPSIGIIKGALEKDPSGGEAQTVQKFGGTHWKKIVTSLVVFIVLGVVAALGYTAFSSIPEMEILSPKRTVDPQALSLELNRMTRIGGLIDLTENKIIKLEESLAQAQKLSDEVLINTFRLGLAKNLDALAGYEEDFIAGLTQIHMSYSQDPDLVKRMLKEKIKKSEEVYKTGTVKTVGTILALIKSVPKEKSPGEYFRENIVKQK